MDCAGGAAGVRPIVRGACRAAAEDGLDLLFVGPREAVEAELRSEVSPLPEGRVAFVDAPVALSPEQDSTGACRDHPEGSVMRAAEKVAAGEADGLVSVGSPGVAAAAGLWHLKRLRGALRPVLAARLPGAKGSLLVDAGLNHDCKPWHVLQFAIMGSIYARLVLGIERPTVGLLAPGEDACGESELIRDALPLLKHAGLSFEGRVRADRLSAGDVDVAVCGGETGEPLVRLYEGLTDNCFEILQSEIESGLFRKMGGRLVRRAVGAARSRLCGALSRPAPILGLGGPVTVCRGGADEEDVLSGVRATAAASASDLTRTLRDRLEDVKSDMEFARTIE